MQHPLPSRIPLAIGFHGKTTRTRKFRAERVFLGCGCGLNHKQPDDREVRRETQSKILLVTRSISVLRVQRRYSALVRFRWLNFDDHQHNQSRNRSDERKLRETQTRTRNTGCLDAAGLFRPGRSGESSPLMTLPQEEMTSGRSGEIADGE
jgi:hypothetical protein